MNAGICVCVLLAALASSSLGRPSHSPNPDLGGAEPPKLDSALSTHTRQARSAVPAEQLTPYSKPNEEEDSRTSLSQILARLISRKGGFQPPRSMSINSRASGPGPSHRIKDRDYLGWMDFGRRSAEEYEYSS
ncbi:cholecystokinin a [Osmerus eperlanus]|uniref:cholecystokinin a n=1 Tax=Osmerus eperlanus TaxID=29151 RepID=UPI002E148C2A